VAGGLGYLLYFALLDRLGPVEINLVSYGIPVFAALVGYVWLHEPITAGTVAGFVVICTGFALVKRRALRRAVSATAR
jgi:drug/metabolite transporter (DMT)-like permease